MVETEIIRLTLRNDKTGNFRQPVENSLTFDFFSPFSPSLTYHFLEHERKMAMHSNYIPITFDNELIQNFASLGTPAISMIVKRIVVLLVNYTLHEVALVSPYKQHFVIALVPDLFFGRKLVEGSKVVVTLLLPQGGENSDTRSALLLVHSPSSGKGKMFLCAACHAFTPHVNTWKN